MESHEWDIEHRGYQVSLFCTICTRSGSHFFSQAEVFTTDTSGPSALDMSQITLSGARWERLSQFLYHISHLIHSMNVTHVRRKHETYKIQVDPMSTSKKLV